MKENLIILNEKGFALLTVLVISLLSLGLIALAFYITMSSTRLFSIDKRYTVELDTAKGVAGYIMAEIQDENLTCNPAASGPCIADSTPESCNANAQIIINPQVCTALGRTNACTGLSACYISKSFQNDPPANTTFYSARVTSLNNNGEKAIIDFVYRTVEN
ncbi:MAG: hypothetical protein KJ900_00635 [Proteobacteria bacterium]|jgi:hypothetical protein|nr:hypothetical protein [Desulfocapsa sp.]MBU3944857.1 hypothetical protein [Pseudomonadota bacterium]MCG2744029.1 hypothetical protein [Desulfobacteraceae bacterium]MBU4029456.1 hypothetical protein [Pseudomonadota bacterium]MBU4041397.1 hypothetical protein [Pseudomonadota bacterium]